MYAYRLCSARYLMVRSVKVQLTFEISYRNVSQNIKKKLGLIGGKVDDAGNSSIFDAAESLSGALKYLLARGGIITGIITRQQHLQIIKGRSSWTASLEQRWQHPLTVVHCLANGILTSDVADNRPTTHDPIHSPSLVHAVCPFQLAAAPSMSWMLADAQNPH